MPDRIADSRAAVRAAVRGVWTGAATSAGQGSDMLYPAIRRYFLLAFNEGMKECGVLPEERTEKERKALVDRIKEELSHVGGFMDAVYEGRKGSETERPLEQFLSRAEMWVNRYTELRDLGKMLACGDRKAMWVLNPLKESCRDCIRLNGKVKRLSTWEKARAQGIYPKSPALACGGFRCGCTLSITDEPMSKGPLPKLSG